MADDLRKFGLFGVSAGGIIGEILHHSHSKAQMALPLRIASVAALTALAIPASAGFDITLSYNDAPTAAESAAFNSAVSTWESIITGYIGDVNVPFAFAGPTIEVNLDPIDGPFGVLGSAGPTAGSSFGSAYVYTTTGQMTFDTADTLRLSNDGELDEVILHEMGHVLGIGTWWNANGLYTNGTGQYTGAAALAAYQVEYDAGAAFIPIELDGGGGTANGHWNESVDNPFSENVNGPDSDPGDTIAGPIAYAGPNIGQSLDDELMTGVLSGTAYISETTKAAYIDLGYNIAPIPEPASALLALVGVGAVVTRRRRTA